IAEAHVEHATLARDELQAIVRAAEFHAQPVAAVPEHCVVALAAASKAQAAAAAAGECPSVRQIPGRAVLRAVRARSGRQGRGVRLPPPAPAMRAWFQPLAETPWRRPRHKCAPPSHGRWLLSRPAAAAAFPPWRRAIATPPGRGR